MWKLRVFWALVVAAFAVSGSEWVGAFSVLKRRGADIDELFSPPVAMVEVQWGRPYTSITGAEADNGDLEFVFEMAVEGAVSEHAENDVWRVEGMAPANGQSDVLLRIEDVQDPDQCRKICRGIQQCVAAHFIENDSVCVLLGTIGQMSPSTHSTVLLASSDQSCFIDGKTVRGPAKPLGTAPSALVCQLICTLHPSCVGFSWKKDSKECRSYADTSTMADADAVSGPRGSCSDIRKSSDYAGVCYEEGISGDAANMDVVQDVKSWEDCHKHCKSRKDCKWLTYNLESKLCHLKSLRGGYYTKSGDQTSPRNCDSSCFMKNVQLQATVLREVKEVRKPHSCQYECTLVDQCAWWTWEDSSQSCTLYGSQGELRGVYSEGSWTGGRYGCENHPGDGGCEAPEMRPVNNHAPWVQWLYGVYGAEECRQACRGTSLCNASVFDSKDSTCKLISLLNGVRPGVGTTVLLPACDSSCFEKSKRHRGKHEPLGSAPSAAICQAMCQAKSSCNGFSWHRESSACFSYPNPSGLQDHPPSVSGPKESCSSDSKPSDYSGSCFQKKITGNGQDHAIFEKVGSSEECHKLCLEDPTCQWLTYNGRDRKCYLKARRGGYSFKKEGDETGPRDCDSSCYMRDISVREIPKKSVPGVANAYTCNYECQMDGGCETWSYRVSTQECFLYTQRVFRGGLAPEVWTGRRGGCAETPAKGGCVYEMMTLTGDDKGSLQKLHHVSSANLCQWACRNIMGCVAGVFNRRDSTCNLYATVSGYAEATNTAVVLPHCDESCFEVGKRWKDDGRVLGKVPNASLCQALCSAQLGCVGFSWKSSDKECKSHEEASETKDSHDHTSGSRKSCSPNAKPFTYAGSCVQEGVSGTGRNIEQIPDTHSWKSCYVRCLGNSQCNWLTYNAHSNVCYLKDERGSSVAFYKEGDVTSPRLCDSSCFMKNVQLMKKPATTKTSIPDPNRCRYECTVDPKCTAWSWCEAAEKCFLYGGEGQQSGVISFGAWSGDKSGCGNEKQFGLPVPPRTRK